MRGELASSSFFNFYNQCNARLITSEVVEDAKNIL